METRSVMRALQDATLRAALKDVRVDAVWHIMPKTNAQRLKKIFEIKNLRLHRDPIVPGRLCVNPDPKKRFGEHEYNGKTLRLTVTIKYKGVKDVRRREQYKYDHMAMDKIPSYHIDFYDAIRKTEIGLKET